jgi:methionyl-tRNA synthetase
MRYNAELANELGNLFSRTLSMVQRYRGGNVPPWTADAQAGYERLGVGVVDDYCAHMDRLEFDESIDAFWRAVQAANRYIEEKKPWELAKSADPRALDDVLRTLLEVLRLCSVLCVPMMPVKSAEMRTLLHLERDVTKISLDEARRPGDPAWKTVGVPSPLFMKIEKKE